MYLRNITHKKFLKDRNEFVPMHKLGNGDDKSGAEAYRAYQQ